MNGVSAGDLTTQNQRGLARALTLVERGGTAAEEFVERLQDKIGHAHICGVTGPPGAGKSAFVERLAMAIRSAGKSVAIIAVDPSSPFSGGAVLGDRLRMGEALRDNDIFMRSLASRGHLGGLSAAAPDSIAVLDAAGFDYIIVETIGAGQSEVEIMRLAHTTLVVTVPGLGDRIQADKAGILEVADMFIVNKSDLAGADKVKRELSGMLDLSHMGDPGLNRWPPSNECDKTSGVATSLAERYGSPHPGGITWRPPVIATVAILGSGTDEVLKSIEHHHLFLTETGRLKARLHRAIDYALRRSVHVNVERQCFDEARADSEILILKDAIATGELSVRQAAERLLKRVFK